MRTDYKAWTQKETDFIIKQRNSNITALATAKEMKRSVASVERKIRSLLGAGKIEFKIDGKGHFDCTEKFIPEIEPDFTDFLKLRGDVISISDVHTPFWHRDIFNKMFSIAKKFKIKQLIFNGDFLNLDSFSSWVTGMRGRKEVEKELKTATYILIECLKVFDKIYLTQGNHEDRLLRTLEGQITGKTFFKMIKTAEMENRFIVSDYPYCELNNTWIIGHPKTYSDRGGQTPTDLANKMDRNVICGHNHQIGFQSSLNGKYIGLDQGMGGNPFKIEYAAKSLTKNRSWQVGFCMVYNNHAYLFPLSFTDWDFWLKKIKI